MAVKPVRTKSSQIFAYVGATPTRRVQSLDWNSNFTVDTVYELGNAGVVEDSVTLVETSVTLNSNEWGTTDLEAMMFGIYEQRNIVSMNAAKSLLCTNALTTIYIGTLGTGESGWAAATVGSWLQVIRVNATATVNDAEYVKISDLTTTASLALKIILDSAHCLTAAPATGDIVTLVNKYTITQDTVDSNPVSLILPHRYSTTATTIMYSVMLPRCAVDNLQYRISTDGAAEQNYTLVGEEERMTLTSRRELGSVTGSLMRYNTTGTVVFRIPRDCAGCFGSPYLVYADSNLAEGETNIHHTSGACTVTATIGEGLTIDSTTQLVYFYTNITKKGWRGLTNIDSGIGKLTKGYVTVELTKTGGSAVQLLRCTGVDIAHPLTRESIDELGSSRSIAKPLEGNLRNELTLTFNRNDLKEYAQLRGLDQYNNFVAGTLTQILMTDLKSVKDMSIVVKFWNSQTGRVTATNLLKTMTYSNCNFIGDTNSTPLTGAAGLELKFSSQTISIVGSGLPPIYV